MDTQRVSPWAQYKGMGFVSGNNAVPYTTAAIVIIAVLMLAGLGYGFRGHVHF